MTSSSFVTRSCGDRPGPAEQAQDLRLGNSTFVPNDATPFEVISLTNRDDAEPPVRRRLV